MLYLNCIVDARNPHAHSLQIQISLINLKPGKCRTMIFFKAKFETSIHITKKKHKQKYTHIYTLDSNTPKKIYSYIKNSKYEKYIYKQSLHPNPLTFNITTTTTNIFEIDIINITNDDHIILYSLPLWLCLLKN